MPRSPGRRGRLKGIQEARLVGPGFYDCRDADLAKTVYCFGSSGVRHAERKHSVRYIVPDTADCWFPYRSDVADWPLGSSRGPLLVPYCTIVRQGWRGPFGGHVPVSRHGGRNRTTPRLGQCKFMSELVWGISHWLVQARGVCHAGAQNVHCQVSYCIVFI